MNVPLNSHLSRQQGVNFPPFAIELRDTPDELLTPPNADGTFQSLERTNEPLLQHVGRHHRRTTGLL